MTSIESQQAHGAVAADRLRGMRILTVNRGSSSVKCSLYAGTDPPTRLLSGNVDRIGRVNSMLTIVDAEGNRRCDPIDASDRLAAVDLLVDRLIASGGGHALGAIGHRLVHGGPRYQKPQRVTAEMVAELHRISAFAPEHLPVEIELIESFSRGRGGVVQIACFDTAFHAHLPAVARLLPIPRRFAEHGIRRYGFHGLSYEYLMAELARVAGAEAAQGRVILAHLGHGASMAAVREGKSIDTSMSFTPAAGFPMSTRAGDLDAGLLWYLTAVEGMTADEIYEMVNRRSGLLGMSETTADMRDLLAKEATDQRAAEAVDLFCYQAAKWIGAFTVALGGLDTLVFSGGIGENAAAVRARICQRLQCLGVVIDEAKNSAHAAVISADQARVTVRVMHTDEELTIARSVLRLLA